MPKRREHQKPASTRCTTRCTAKTYYGRRTGAAGSTRAFRAWTARRSGTSKSTASLGHEQKLEARIVNYADDFVICCRGTADEAMTVMRSMMSRIKLTVNETQTHICHVPAETFDFLGYTFGQCYAPKTGRAYLGTQPARAKVQKLCQSLSALTDRKSLWLDPEEIVGRFNSRLRGWANYFCLGAVSKAYRAVEQHAAGRLRKWLCRKHKVPGQGTARFPDEYLFQTLGLVRLTCLPRRYPQRKRE